MPFRNLLIRKRPYKYTYTWIEKSLFHSNSILFVRTPFKLADIGEGISEVEVLQWFVKEGDKVEEFSKICEVQSDKAAVEISSRYEGTILALNYKVGDIAKVGSALVDIDTVGEEVEEEQEKASNSEVDAPQTKTAVLEAPQKTISTNGNHDASSVTFATPAVRRVAREHNVDLKLIQGTGPQGRILKGDVSAFVKSPNQATKNSHQATSTVTSNSADTIQPLTNIQKAMFKSMTKSLSIPHFGFSDEVYMNAAFKFRQDLNKYIESLPKGTYPFEKISFTPIFLKALSEALKTYPILNAQLVNLDTTPSLLYRTSHNIGIAMDTPLGLVVPNIKNVQLKSIFEIAADLEQLKIKGQKGNLSSTDLQNGTITLSNIGSIGGTALHPVLVTSEVCIGAVGKVQRLPRYETINGVETVVAKEVMHASFNADHRVIDGATVARFVQLWKTYLETPTILAAKLI